MILKGLADRIPLAKGAPPSYRDHHLYTGEIIKPYYLDEHYTGLGLICILKGRGNFRINGNATTLTEDSFIVINRGSKLTVDITNKHTVPVFIFFDTVLSEIAANSLLFSPQSPTSKDPNDFRLIEHIHYTHASLKSHLQLLIDLGKSCASFHALKADMVLRSILNDLIHENYTAIKISSNLDVVKTSTRIELYKRLAVAREWMDQNYHAPVTLEKAADISMLNRSHFLRLFKQAFNVTPHQYLTQIRLASAKNLLLSSGANVRAICQQVGFESLSSFSSMFKQHVGVSPALFRKHYLLTT